ncbi:hypothetical protein LJC56_10080 [Christensenellaceae bacterium OttesenSCG-928-K19]|nr:hypothetical protein [Christensenellaceae bacterium OttesenSCG-928-K19]
MKEKPCEYQAASAPSPRMVKRRYNMNQVKLNGGYVYHVLHQRENEALLSNDHPAVEQYVIAHNMKELPSGDVEWDYGQYFATLKQAVIAYYDLREQPEKVVVEVKPVNIGDVVFMDGHCPECGSWCGNGGSGPLKCSCGWIDKTEWSEKLKEKVKEIFDQEFTEEK